MKKPTGRVIDGSVEAKADSSHVALNQPNAIPAESAPFYFRETQHQRVTPIRKGDTIEFNIVSLFERIPEGGAWPEHLPRFQGVGRLDASHPATGPISRSYRFDVPGHTLEEAWSNFEAATGPGSELAAAQLRQEIAGMLRQQKDRLAVATPQHIERLLGPDGRPLHG